MGKMIEVLIFLAGILTIVIVAGFAGFGLLDWIKGNQAKWKRLEESGDLTHELDELRIRVEDLERRGLTSGEVEAQYTRIGELEERLDFTERILAQRNDQVMLPGDRRNS